MEGVIVSMSGQIKAPEKYRNGYVRYIIYFVLFIIMLCYYYVDVNSNVRQGINFWKALFSGRFFHFYSYNSTSRIAGEMVHEANYSILTHLFMAVWQFPLFIIESIFKVNVQDFYIARVYSKLYLLILAFMSGRVINKITYKISSDEIRASFAELMFLSSGLMCTSVVVDSQIEIMAIFMTLKAIEAAVEGNRKKFICWFIISAQCKFIALVFLVPVLLYFEKKLLKIIGIAACPMVLYFLTQLPFNIIDKAGISSSNSRSTDALMGIFGNIRSIDGVIGIVGFILYAVLCLYSFIKKNDNSENTMYMIYAPVCAYFCIFKMFYEPYRLMCVIPFLAILVVCSSRPKIGMWLVTLWEIVLTIVTYIDSPWCYDFDAMRGMLLDKIRGFDSMSYQVGLEYYFIKIEQFIPYNVYNIALRVSVVILTIILFMMIREKNNGKDNEKYGSKTDVFARGICCYGFSAIYILFFLRCLL